MIVLRPKGGLGNQFFQYAAGRALAARHQVPLRFDVRWYGRPEHQRSSVRTFDLGHFQVQGAIATPAELAAFAYPENHRLRARIVGRLLRAWRGGRIWRHEGLGWTPEFDRLGRHVLIEGYFQDPAYFAPVQDLLQQELQFHTPPPAPIRARAAELAALPSVCIQVRRTDFVTDAEQARVHGTCTLDYFRFAWAHVTQRVPDAQGFVFADDPNWAKEAFDNWPAISVIGPEWNGPDYLHQFFLMRSCRHFIIANSTWGWWAAWLGSHTEKVVVMPQRWFADRTLNETARGLRVPGWELG
jgi:Glycosyl transferase family 11